MKRLLSEANRCLKCKNALCQKHCPINTNILEVIMLFEEGKIQEAGELLSYQPPLQVVV